MGREAVGEKQRHLHSLECGCCFPCPTNLSSRLSDPAWSGVLDSCVRTAPHTVSPRATWACRAGGRPTCELLGVAGEPVQTTSTLGGDGGALAAVRAWTVVIMQSLRVVLGCLWTQG